MKTFYVYKTEQGKNPEPLGEVRSPKLKLAVKIAHKKWPEVLLEVLRSPYNLHASVRAVEISPDAYRGDRCNCSVCKGQKKHVCHCCEQGMRHVHVKYELIAKVKAS